MERSSCAPGPAARLHAGRGQFRCVAAILAERGADIVAAEGVRPVLDLVEGLPETVRTREIRLLHDRARSLAAAGELLREARYGEALSAAEHATTLVAGDDSMLAAAFDLRGQALTRLGRPDVATESFERSIASRPTESALCHLGDLHRALGRFRSSATAYHEALRLRPDSAPAHTGLAEVDPSAVRELPDTAAPALRARMALAAGRREEAAELAGQAVEHAVRRQDRAGLAEAMELTALFGDPPAARLALTEARSIWQAAGARLCVARVAVRLGELPGATVPDRIDARAARDLLAAHGMPAPEPSVVIRTLGRFEVTVGGRPVPATAWQSRKARDLLRILVVRRGCGIPREELAALLWHDDDSAKVGHRLSVALSTVRAVLDPHKRVPADHYLRATQTAVALDPTRLTVDVEDFLSEAEHGLRHSARSVLEHVESSYPGDLFEDEPYDDWATPLREQARATYLRVVRTLAELHRKAGDTDATVRCLHLLLAKDPYDEQAHLDLIDTLDTAGCHGEARRARTRYTAAMCAVA